jgi:alkylation response protein AidB-like acyl-CoA dehydrogenase
VDFSLSESQQEVRNLARKILEDLSRHERLVEIEASPEGIDRRVWEELARSQLLGVALPEAYGGSDMGFFTLCVLIEEVGRAVAPVPALPSLVMGALPVAAFGSDEQKQRWLPGVVSGSIILTAALQEAGSDEPSQPTTEARRDGGAWRLSGTRICVPAAHVAERILVPARVAGAGVGVFLIDPAAAGVELREQQVTNRERQFQLALTDAPVAAADVLAGPERGAEITRWGTDRATAAYCALQLGVAEKALRMTAAYTGERRQFDRPIGSFQAVHQRAADAFIDVEAMRLTTWQAVWKLDAGHPADDAIAVAKFWAADGGQRAGYAAQHLHGGIGVDVDYPLHRYYLWAKQIELTLGSAPVHLARIGERLAREPVETGAQAPR